MKTKVCKCIQCRAVRARTRKRNRIQTAQVRAARSKVKQLLHTLPIDKIEDELPKVVSADYYG